jgi:hypothetical protein
VTLTATVIASAGVTPLVAAAATPITIMSTTAAITTITAYG